MSKEHLVAKVSKAIYEAVLNETKGNEKLEGGLMVAVYPGVDGLIIRNILFQRGPGKEAVFQALQNDVLSDIDDTGFADLDESGFAVNDNE